MSSVETFGQRIKRERLARGMTQRDLAAAVDVGVPHISKIESGKENPSDDLIEKLAIVLKVEGDELMLVAHRLPGELMDKLAADPSEALEFLRTWKPDG